MAAGRHRPPGPVAVGTALVAIGATVWLAVRPHTADMAAQVFRAGIAEREGFAIWNGQWYGGHHLAPYSVLSPMLGGLVGAWWAGAIAAVLAGFALSRLAVTAAPDRRTATVAAALLSTGVLAALACGRTTYLLGVGFGALALEALLADRRAPAWILPSLLTPLASPVAGAFLALCATARANLRGVASAALALIPILALSFAFPGGGDQPFSLRAFAATLVACIVGLLVVPQANRRLRLAIVLYAGATVLVFVIGTPVGANITRLGQLAAAPLFAIVLLPTGRTRTFLLLLPLALAWQWWAPVTDLQRAATDRAASDSFHAPLVREMERLERATDEPGRLEVVWTRSRWEAAVVAPRVQLARGWERQLDSRFNEAVNGREITAADYRDWLDSLSVRWVAIANAPVEPSATGEARLIRSGLPWLEPVWRSNDWTIYEVADPTPLGGKDTAIEVTQLGSERVLFEVRRPTGPGGVTVAVRWTRHWKLEGVDGCIAPQVDSSTGTTARDAMTTIVARSAGHGRLVIDPFGGGPRCD